MSTTPAPAPTLEEVMAELVALRGEFALLADKVLLSQVTGLDDGTKRARPLRGVLAVLNNRTATIRADLAGLIDKVDSLQRSVDGGPVQ